MERKVVDCRNIPESECTVKIEGTEDEVMKLATRHAIEEHGYENTPALKKQIRTMMMNA